MTPLIKVDTEKCNNCHSCISVCPVKHCMDGSGDKIAIIPERCLGCGRCITACTSGARSINDDTKEFFDELDARTPMVMMVAPSAAAVFDDIFRMTGFLKSCGVAAVFDVAFGAELTAKSYIEYARRENPKVIIAQPCPAIVNYCELYAPHLIPYLAPVHSPMLHTAIMIKNYFPQFANAKIAVISPCAAKKREFEETGYIDFNVTMTGFKSMLKRRGINLDDYKACDFDGPMAERAVAFSSPGGLKSTILRDAPALAPRIRRIEGTFTVYKYLSDLPRMLEENITPFFIDCLSCFTGCNGGPGTENFNHPVALMETRIEARLNEQARRNKLIFGGNRIKGEVSRYWRPEIYSRSYTDRSENLSGYHVPTNKDLAAIYQKMKKTSEADFLNCAACGYGDCRGMAEAIFNKLNRPENCHHYLKKEVDERLQEHKNILEYVRDGIFLLEKNGHILPSYSTALEEIFRRDMLAGVSIMDVFSGFIDKKKLKEIDTFIDKAFDILIPDSEIQSDNPLREVEIHFENLDGGIDTRHLNFVIERIGDEKTIQKLLVIVRETSGKIKEAPPPRNKTPVFEFTESENCAACFSKNETLKELMIEFAERSLPFYAGHPEGREAPEHFTFDARVDAGSLYISCRHNGAGLDPGKIAARALYDGLVTEEAASGLSEQEKTAYFYKAALSGIEKKLKSLSCHRLRFSNKKDHFRFDLEFPKKIVE
ncbi:MAG: 4Fe-4S binding protein [Spirochaetaceae bacterium]|nr:4Fe-4S binding protein [Spirochaetaceae bacterium]